MRKQILILGHNYVTHFIDIYNQYTRLFPEDKYEVTVVYLTGAPNDEVRQRTLAKNVIFLNIPKKKIRMLKLGAIKQMLALTRKKKFDLVICHRYKPSYIMMWVAQFWQISCLIFVMHELHTMKSINRQLLIATLARKNMLFAGVSNAVRDDIRKDLWCVPQDRIITLYNTIDIELMEPKLFSRADARQTLHLSEDAFVFGTLARLAVNKDQKSLIQAFAAIKPHCPKAKLIIIGEGELESTLRTQVAALGLSADVIFTGYLAGGFRYMQAFDCFVLSSIQEAFGRVLIEAMIAKLPIIATRVHGIPEVIADAGKLVPARDVTRLAEAMLKEYATSKMHREQQGLKAYAHVVANFSIPAFAKVFWQLPQVQMLKSNGPARSKELS